MEMEVVCYNDSGKRLRTRVPAADGVFYSVLRRGPLRGHTALVDVVDVVPLDAAQVGDDRAGWWHPRYHMTVADCEYLEAHWPSFAGTGLAAQWRLQPDSGDGARALTTAAAPHAVPLVTLERVVEPFQGWLEAAVSEHNPAWRRAACAAALGGNGAS